MKARITNSAVRWVVLAGTVVASGMLIAAAARNALAQHWVASVSPDRWLRGAELEPSDPQNWDRLGRYRQLDFENADLPLAISYYQRATSLDPASALYWTDLASAYETRGDFSLAEQAFRTAQQAYPISGEVAWKFGSFLLRQGRIDEAFEQVRRAVAADPKLTMPAVSQCWRSTQDINRILKFALPKSPAAYWGAIDVFVNAGQPDPALAAWKQLAATGASFPAAQAFRLIDLLIEPGHEDDAKLVWQQTLSAAGVKPTMGPPSSLIWNGGFEGELMNGGLAWRYQPTDGATADFDPGNAHSGSRSLRVVFDGSANVNFQQIWQYVIVEPNTHYKFSAYVRTAELTTDTGIRFAIVSENFPVNSAQKSDPTRLTPNVVGTQPWTAQEVEFTTGPAIRMLRVFLVRQPSNRLGNKIRGTAWVDDVSLVPIAATGGADQ